MTPLQEAKLINRAVRNRWDIPPEEQKKTIDRVVYLRDNALDESTQMAAIRAIVSMVGQNQKDEHKVVDVRVATRHDELAGIASDLGIEISAIEAADRASRVDIASSEESCVEGQRD